MTTREQRTIASRAASQLAAAIRASDVLAIEHWQERLAAVEVPQLVRERRWVLIAGPPDQDVA